ncbi:MAG: hypothetical protein HUU21_06380 [Polyangiaceae bacterium]|nr:hypothetical protein [Polyangiaceae bacterium]NUQ73162.1 hypothetical protein [Polyangiaceae bacterium]
MRTHGGRLRLGQAGILGFLAVSCFGGIVLTSSPSLADEPRSATEPRVMMESGEVTNVIDAFDDGDPFDINVSLGFDFASKSARILRETNIYDPGLTTGGYTANTLNVADYAESTARLIPRVDVGIYKDLALYLKLPIILSHSRELTGVDGSDTPGAQDVALAGAPSDGRLFSLPFTSPTRSGIEYIGVGLDFNILAQHRDRTKPTWLMGIEGRFSVGEPMHACNDAPGRGQVKCAHPSDLNRNGVNRAAGASENEPFEGEFSGERDPGVSRGTIGLEFHTIMSKRIKYVEPYGGFKALVEFQQESSDYGLTDLEGSLVNHPPLVGTVLAGIMIIPWEDREKFTRLTFDLRFEAQYHSEGRDYSELFDALGSSSAPTLRNPQWARYANNPDFTDPSGCLDNDPMTPCNNGCFDSDNNTACFPRSVVDQSSQQTYTTGLTDVQAYGSYRISASATWQAAKFVKLNFGMGLKQDQGHGITADQPCNPEFKDSLGEAGPCRSGEDAPGATVRATGVPNPNYRASINSIGRRFFVADSTTFDIFASATVMF